MEVPRVETNQGVPFARVLGWPISGLVLECTGAGSWALFAGVLDCRSSARRLRCFERLNRSASVAVVCAAEVSGLGKAGMAASLGGFWVTTNWGVVDCGRRTATASPRTIVTIGAIK